MLVQQWLPLVPQTSAKLRAGARVADVGCGTGQALIALARAFPAITATGYDAHPPSVEQARRAAAEAGLVARSLARLADNRRSGHSEAVMGHGQGDAERVDEHDGGDQRQHPPVAARGRAREPAAGQREQESQDEEPRLEDGEVVERGEVLLPGRQGRAPAS